MIFEYKDKNCDSILPYTYMLIFNIENKIKYYYGVRYGNVKLNKSPKDDLFKFYFSSSKYVINLLNNNITPVKIVIHKTFNSYIEACKFEVDFLSKVNAKNRCDFLNQTDKFNNSLPNNSGRILSKETRKKISDKSKALQSTADYRELRSNLMKSKWLDTDFIEKMKDLNFKYKQSGKSKIAGQKSGSSRIGYKYSDEVKIKRSDVMKKVCENIDMKLRVSKRKKYNCPICNLLNLDGGNFNSHMKSKHHWSKIDCKNFKCS